MQKFGIFITEVETKTRFWFHRKGANYHKVGLATLSILQTY